MQFKAREREMRVLYQRFLGHNALCCLEKITLNANQVGAS
ncbi:hypothetical protein [Escherichia coli IS1]|nr:hypothetical protein AC58_5022 [Escherichia coli 3-105-05_S3_C3]UFD96079.1 hypothetical protein [Escherichia coli]CDK44376.1 hypothetical protein [Escherichia coli IS1]